MAARSPTPITARKERPRSIAFHPGGANFLMADGSVRFIKETVGIRVFARLVTRAGGEIISAEQY